MEKEKRVAAGALWKKTSRDSVTYFNIRIGDKAYVAFPNDFIRKDTDPDYNIYLSRPKPE